MYDEKSPFPVIKLPVVPEYSARARCDQVYGSSKEDKKKMFMEIKQEGHKLTVTGQYLPTIYWPSTIIMAINQEIWAFFSLYVLMDQ